jgi:hypothetical protein
MKPSTPGGRVDKERLASDSSGARKGLPMARYAGYLSRRRFLQGSLALAGLGLLSGCGLLPPGAPQPPKAAGALDVQLFLVTAPRANYLGTSFADTIQGPVDGLIMLADAYTRAASPGPFADFAAEKQLPAQTLGLTVPQSILIQATEVVQ